MLRISHYTDRKRFKEKQQGVPNMQKKNATPGRKSGDGLGEKVKTEKRFRTISVERLYNVIPNRPNFGLVSAHRNTDQQKTLTMLHPSDYSQHHNR